MPSEYSQNSGTLRQNGVVIYVGGYSGYGYAKDKPDMESIQDMGPIPRGAWEIGTHFHHPRKGPYTMTLSPYGHDAHGRTNFLIHGENPDNIGNSSEGCIILPLPIRKRIAASGDSSLTVVR